MSFDSLRRWREVTDARRTFDGLRRLPLTLAPEVGASWQRCLAGLPVTTMAPPAKIDACTQWQQSLIRRAAPGVIDSLSQLARSENYIAAVTDSSGNIIWSAADLAMGRLAERVNFVDGTNWCEEAVGTNAPALALRTGAPSTVFGAEHWSESVRDWVCYAAPVRAPNGRVLGAVDLSSTWRHASPMAQSTVSAMALLIERQLESTWSIDHPGVELRSFGGHRLMIDGRAAKLSLRQAEILTVLAVEGSASLARLHDLLYGDRPVTLSTLKAEISHLRRTLGSAVSSRPYRIEGQFDSDVVSVLTHIERGDVVGALRRYDSPLLPESESPFIAELRHRIDVGIRSLVLRDGRVDDIRTYLAVNPHDIAVIEHGIELAGPGHRHREELCFRLERALS